MFFNPLITEAKESSKEPHHNVDQYVTPKGILLALISPEIDKIIKSKYKKNDSVSRLPDGTPVWNYGKITDVQVKGNSEGKGWYIIEMFVHVGEPDVAKLDKIEVKVDIPK